MSQSLMVRVALAGMCRPLFSVSTMLQVLVRDCHELLVQVLHLVLLFVSKAPKVGSQPVPSALIGLNDP